MSDKEYFPMPDLSEPKPTLEEIKELLNQFDRELWALATYEEYLPSCKKASAHREIDTLKGKMIEAIRAFGCNHE